MFQPPKKPFKILGNILLEFFFSILKIWVPPNSELWTLAAALGSLACLAVALGPLACLSTALGPFAFLAAAFGPFACLAAALGLKPTPPHPRARAGGAGAVLKFSKLKKKNSKRITPNTWVTFLLFYLLLATAVLASMSFVFEGVGKENSLKTNLNIRI